MTRTVSTIVMLLAALVPTVARAGVSAGDAVDVAPRVEGTRCQMWPRAAWSEGAQNWLVAWREGHTNELATDIRCARVGADGRTLDPEGIKVCAAADNQERPAVASDGKDFLVVWEDLRNGRDYDVYAARVSADGKVLDPDGFLLAGGEHNQCHPVATFAGGNYYVAWQGFDGAGGRYLLYGARVSTDGKVLDADGIAITQSGGKGDALDETASAYNPTIAAAGERILVGHLIAAGTGKMKCSAGIVSVNAKSGQPEGKPQVLGPAEQRLPILAFGDGGGLFGAPLKESGLALYRLDASGKGAGKPENVTNGARGGGLPPLYSLAFDGKAYLVTLDRGATKGRTSQQVQVFGMSVPAEGQLAADAELIAGEGDRAQMQGFACSGPQGVCMVTCVDVRGADDLKVVARLVK